MQWSATQAHILTGGGRAEALYTSERGFPFSSDQLPHHQLAAGTTREAFGRWRRGGGGSEGGGGAAAPAWLSGAWSRPLFCGGGSTSTDADEACLNIVTPSLFVDIRIPTARGAALASLGANGAARLRLLARQHGFGGFGRFSDDGAGGHALSCTRHHAIDWNFLGTPRPRPNRWGVARLDSGTQSDEWREDSFATDETGAPYYYEVWRRLGAPKAAATHPLLAMRSLPETASGRPAARDTIVVSCAGHFSYVSMAAGATAEAMRERARALGEPSRAGAVDAAVAAGELELARWLVEEDVRAGHGAAGGEWRIRSALQPADQAKGLAEVVLLATAGGSGQEESLRVGWRALLAAVDSGELKASSGNPQRPRRVVGVGELRFEVFEAARAGDY